MHFRYENIKGRCGEILKDLFSLPGLPEEGKKMFNLRLALEEAVQNKVDHAYGTGDGWLEIEASCEGGEFEIELADGGESFDPLSLADPDLDLSVDDRTPGGLGVFLYKQLMDSVTYSRVDGKNLLKMKLRLE